MNKDRPATGIPQNLGTLDRGRLGVKLSGALCSFAPLLAGALVPAAAADGPPAYVITQKVPLGTPDRWDYLTLDKDRARLYVAHGDRVDVLDSKTGAMVGRIEGMPGGTHGIAVVHSLNKGYTDDGRAGEIVAFDLDTLKVVTRITGQPDADGIVFDSKSQRLFVINGESENLTVVDPRTDRVVATVQVGGGLEFGVADGQGKLFVNGEARREVVRIDTESHTVDARWPIPGCESPHGMAMDPLARRLFVSCRNAVLTVVDAQSGAVIATVPIGRGTDDAGFDPQRQLIFSSNGLDGTVSVIKQESGTRYRSVGEIVTALTGRTMAVDPESGRLFVAAASAKPALPAPTAAPGTAGRAQIEPGSLKVYFIDPR